MQLSEKSSSVTSQQATQLPPELASKTVTLNLGSYGSVMFHFHARLTLHTIHNKPNKRPCGERYHAILNSLERKITTYCHVSGLRFLENHTIKLTLSRP